MKKAFIISIVFFLFLSKSFSNSDYLTGALGLDFSYNPVDVKMSDLPVMPGLFISWNDYKDNKRIGFHFDANVLGIYSPKEDKEDSYSLMFSFCSLIGPSFIFGNNTHVVISPGWTFGTRIGDTSDSDDREITNSIFQLFTGAGVNFEFLFSSKFSIQIPMGYFPLNYSTNTKYRNNVKIETTKRNIPMIKIGIFLGMWT